MNKKWRNCELFFFRAAKLTKPKIFHKNHKNSFIKLRSDGVCICLYLLYGVWMWSKIYLIFCWCWSFMFSEFACFFFFSLLFIKESLPSYQLPKILSFSSDDAIFWATNTCKLIRLEREFKLHLFCTRYNPDCEFSCTF